MNNSKRLTGAIFCMTAGIIYAVRYIVAAIFMSGVSSWDAVLFREGLRYQGTMPLIIALIFAVVGVVYLVRAEREEK